MKKSCGRVELSARFLCLWDFREVTVIAPIKVHIFCPEFFKEPLQSN